MCGDVRRFWTAATPFWIRMGVLIDFSLTLNFEYNESFELSASNMVSSSLSKPSLGSSFATGMVFASFEERSELASSHNPPLRERLRVLKNGTSSQFGGAG